MIYIYQTMLADGLNIEAVTAEQQAVFKAHLDYLTAAGAEDRLIMNGTCTDFAFGVVIFKADSLEDAQTFMAADPAIAQGLMTGELHPFQIQGLG